MAVRNPDDVERRYHDALFKHAFSRVEHARALLAAILPAELVAQMDLDTLEVVPGSFVDDEPRQYHSDLLFTVKVGGKKSLMYILLEHQASVDGLMSFRILRYTVKIWSQWLRDNPGTTRLPPVIPVVFYNGQRPWSAATDVVDVIEGPEALIQLLRPYLPSQRFVLEDVTTHAPEDIRERTDNSLARLVYFALQQGRSAEDIAAQLPGWADDIEAGRRMDLETLVLVFCYLMVANNSSSPERLARFLGPKVGPRVEELIMTPGMKIHQRGVELGIEQGELRGQAKTLLNQIKLKFGVENEETTTRVTNADQATLDRWTAAILTADSLEALFAAAE